jgi:peptidoglycan/xylan/chitin deacetylase (PgdA/CDA1 family)
LNPKEIEAAVNHGIDMVLSLDNGNYKEILPLLKEKNVPAVILPTNFSEGYVPHTPADRVASMQKLVEACDGLEVKANTFAGNESQEKVVIKDTVNFQE